jgi:cell division protein FtsL
MKKLSKTAAYSCRRKSKFGFDLKILSSKKFLLFLSVFVVVFSLGVYMIQVNNMATKGYEMKILEKQILELKEQNQKYSLELLELQSMQSLRNRVSELSLVEAEKINYLDINTSLAQR